MTKQILAIANCRVSSDEQLKNNSLSRQRTAVTAAAERLGVTIPADGWWSGSVSSKRGENLKRKDIREMIAYCKRNKDVKYLLVDEPDRFMRSINEAMYFEVVFSELGVTIWYASDAGLNSNDLGAKLLKFSKYFSAEGSNEERQDKSITGLTNALRAGRWPFPPPVGYRKGYVNGMPEIDESRGPVLKRSFMAILEYRMTPSEALASLNKTEFVKDKAIYKMDKFRAICTNPFYAGVVEMNKQVVVRNENGQHEPLITLEQHRKLVEIFSNRKKTQLGPRKNGNPEYPLSNIVHCENCKDEKYGRYVGFKVNNGVNKQKIYHKYRCRTCKGYLTREDLHAQVTAGMNRSQLTDQGKNELIAALNRVWATRRRDALVDKARVANEISSLEKSIANRVDAAILPENSPIKSEIMHRIVEDKKRLEDLREQYADFDKNDTAEKDKFLRFALDRAENLEMHFLALPKNRILQCKQLLFPCGFWIDTDKKVYTPEMSILYRLAGNKKDLPETEKSSMVRVKRL